MMAKYKKQVAKHSYCWIVLVLLTIWPLAGQAATMDTTEVSEYILHSTQAMLDLAVENKAILAEDPEKYYQTLQDYMGTWVNFSAFTRGVMGESYKEATPEQIAAFGDKILFTLLETYSKVLHLIDPNSIGIDRGYLRKQKKQEKKNGKRRYVGLVARIKEGDEYPFLYSVRLDKDDRWRVRNIIFSGVNLGLTYRSKFTSAINDPMNGGSINKVIKNWTVN